jgi:hypothetical protein
MPFRFRQLHRLGLALFFLPQLLSSAVSGQNSLDNRSHPSIYDLHHLAQNSGYIFSGQSYQLAPGSLKAPKSVQTTLLGISSSTDISLVSPFAWIAQGATVDIPLTARLLSNGVPVGGGIVNYQILKGSGSLSSSDATSDLHGFAHTTLHLVALSGDVR